MGEIFGDSPERVEEDEEEEVPRPVAARFQVVLLVDTSGSMALSSTSTQTRLQAVFNATHDFAKALSSTPDIVCSLVTFNDVHEVVIEQEPTQGPGLRKKLREAQKTTFPSGGGRYVEALWGLKNLSHFCEVNVGILLSDGVPTEELIDKDPSPILKLMAQIRRQLGERCKLHTVGFGRFDATCLKQLAAAGSGRFFDNQTLDASMLRHAFLKLSEVVTTLRTSVLTFGAAALEKLPPRDMEPQDAWQSACEAEREQMAEPHWAWIMIGEDAPSSSSSSSKAISDGSGGLRPVGDARLVQLHKKPFAQGGLRYAFHVFTDPDLHLVVKESKFKVKHSSPQEVHTAFLETHRRAEALAKSFKQACKGFAHNPVAEAALARAMAVNFTKAFVIKITDETTESGFRFVTAERYIPGVYIKYNANEGWVNDNDDLNTDDAVVAAAFSHFTFEHTNGKELCVDIQGVGLQWTDPGLHSRQGGCFGPGDLGAEGMRRFFKTHQCNTLCCALGLHAVDAGTLELGNAAVQLEVKACMVCMDGERKFVCRPCSHLCYCADCAEACRSLPCPVCRKQVLTLVSLEQMVGRMSGPPSTYVKPPRVAAPAQVSQDSVVYNWKNILQWG